MCLGVIQINRHIILFTDGNIKGFPHVSIFKECKHGWLFVDFFATGNMDVRVLDKDILTKWCRHNRSVEFNLLSHNPFYIGTTITLSCVNMVKLYLGIKEFSVITADELYSFLSTGKIGVKQKILAPFKFIYLYFKFLFKRLRGK